MRWSRQGGLRTERAPRALLLIALQLNLGVIPLQPPTRSNNETLRDGIVVKRVKLGAVTRVVIALFAFLIAGGGVVALADRDWVAALGQLSLAAICAYAVVSGRDPENPDGEHRSFRSSGL